MRAIPCSARVVAGVFGLAALGLIGHLLSAAAVRAAEEPRLVINEVLYDVVGNDTGHEWIELFNAGTGAGDVGGWSLERGGTRFTPVFTFPAGATLEPGAFLVVGEAAVPDADFTAVLTLQNGGDATDGIRLKDAAGKVADVVLYDQPNTSGLPDETENPGTSFAPDASEGKSLARLPDGKDTNASGADFGVAGSTPGAPNESAPATVSTSPRPEVLNPANLAGVVVSEVLPDPVGSDTAGEFIELWNTGGNPLDLGGSKLDDAEGGSSPYSIPLSTVLAPGAYRSFPYGETKIALNNSGDSVRLITAGGVVVSALTYGGVPREGASWIRTGGDAAEWSLTPTPGAANVLTPLPLVEKDKTSAAVSPRPQSATTARDRTAGSPDTSSKVSLSAVRDRPLGERVEVQGVVMVPPGLLGVGVFYVMDWVLRPPHGLQIFVEAGDLPGLNLGTRVSVTGRVSSRQNEARLKTVAGDVHVMGRGAPPSPVAVSAGDIGESLEGVLVRVRGTVARRSGNALVVGDASGSVRVLVKPTTGWPAPRLSREAVVSVVGVVSQSGERYRLLPRYADDLVVHAAGEESPSFQDRGVEGAKVRAEVAGARTEARAREPAVSPSQTLPSGQSVPGSTARRGGFSLTTVFLWSAAGVLGFIQWITRRSA